MIRDRSNDDDVMTHNRHRTVAKLDAAASRRIIADLVEAAATINQEWTLAVSAEEHGDLDLAMTHLANAAAQLGLVPIQLEDIRAAVDGALEDLEGITEAR
jgi:hypothetical protein